MELEKEWLFSYSFLVLPVLLFDFFFEGVDKRPKVISKH